MKDINDVLFKKNVKFVEEMKLLQNFKMFTFFIIQSFC